MQQSYSLLARVRKTLWQFFFLQTWPTLVWHLIDPYLVNWYTNPMNSCKDIVCKGSIFGHSNKKETFIFFILLRIHIVYILALDTGYITHAGVMLMVLNTLMMNDKLMKMVMMMMRWTTTTATAATTTTTAYFVVRSICFFCDANQWSIAAETYSIVQTSFILYMHACPL